MVSDITDVFTSTGIGFVCGTITYVLAPSWAIMVGSVMTIVVLVFLLGVKQRGKKS